MLKVKSIQKMRNYSQEIKDFETLTETIQLRNLIKLCHERNFDTEKMALYYGQMKETHPSNYYEKTLEFILGEGECQ